MSTTDASSDLRLTPAVALWALPIGTAGVGCVDLLIQAGRLGADPLSLLLGAFTTLLPGLLAGLVLALTSLGLRRLAARPQWAKRWPKWRLRLPLPTTAAALALVCALIAPLGFWAINRGLAAYHAHPLKSQTEEAPLVAALFFCIVVLAVPLATSAIRRLAEALERVAVDPYWIAGGSIALLAGIGGAQIQGDPGTTTHFAWVLPLALVLLWASAGAYLVAAAESLRPLRGRSHVAGFLLLGAVGIAGLHRPATRALLFHDARVFEQVFRAGFQIFDRDGDRDFPTWLGWGDCDNGNAQVSSIHAEIPGNRIDDNCFGGDRAIVQRRRPDTATGPRPPVIVITIDTLSASHLDLHGYARKTAPNLSAFAKRNRWFRRAYAPANHTFISMLPMLSGQSVERLGVAAGSKDFSLLSFSLWLPHELRKLGYHNVAISPPTAYLKMPPEELRFDVLDPVARDVDSHNVNVSSRPVVDRAITVLQEHPDGQPLLMWVHLLDPHAFHSAPPSFPGSLPVDQYDNEIAWTDEQLGRLLTAIADRWGDQAIVAISSDHGEQFGELGFHGHGWSLRDSEIHVPLILAGPGFEPGEVSQAVSVTSLAPSILQALQQPDNPKASAPSIARGTPNGPVLSFSPAEGRMAVALVDGPWKLIRARGSATSLLFNLEDDPAEGRNLAASQPDVLASMEQHLRELLEAEP